MRRKGDKSEKTPAGSVTPAASRPSGDAKSSGSSAGGVFWKMFVRSVVGTLMMAFFYLTITTRPFLILPCFVFALQVAALSLSLSFRHTFSYWISHRMDITL